MGFFKKLKDKFSAEAMLNEVQQENLERIQAEWRDDEADPDEENQALKDIQEEEIDDTEDTELEEMDTEITDQDQAVEEALEEEVEEEPLSPAEEPPASFVTASKYKTGLAKSRNSFSGRINDLVARYRSVDEDFFEDLEEILITADVGVTTVMDMIEELKMEARRRNIKNSKDLREVISEKLVEIYIGDNEEGMQGLNINPNGLTIVLFVGVNGVGKTTTIGKMAYNLKNEGKHVMLAAGDTFRAGAIEQLDEWGKRAGVDVIKHASGSDPAAVVFDGIKAAKSRNADVLLCDTAGRLQNKVNLMNELTKINRVIEREVPGAPHEVLLVLDATTGQNAMNQARTFLFATDVSGIVLTKLDGTAKGGIVLGIRHELEIPVKFVGLGEKVTDLQIFDPEAYVYGLFADVIDEETP